MQGETECTGQDGDDDQRRTYEDPLREGVDISRGGERLTEGHHLEYEEQSISVSRTSEETNDIRMLETGEKSCLTGLRQTNGPDLGTTETSRKFFIVLLALTSRD